MRSFSLLYNLLHKTLATSNWRIVAGFGFMVSSAHSHSFFISLVLVCCSRSVLVLPAVCEVAVHAIATRRLLLIFIPHSVSSLLLCLFLGEQALQLTYGTFDLILVQLETVGVESLHHLLSVYNFALLWPHQSSTRFVITHQPLLLQFIVWVTRPLQLGLLDRPCTGFGGSSFTYCPNGLLLLLSFILSFGERLSCGCCTREPLLLQILIFLTTCMECTAFSAASGFT